MREILIAAARAGRPITYSQLLAKLGHRFTHPKMRALCETLARVDRAAIGGGEPGTAVLVVRRADGLPGQGWWTGQPDLMLEFEPSWMAAMASAHVAERQRAAVEYWRGEGSGRSAV